MLSKERIKNDFRRDVMAEQISKILTEAILDDLLKGGERLVESELQKQFGVSRSPLREAFRDLEKKGLVTITPRRGTFVKRITSKDIRENFPVRATLEGLAAKEAFSKISDKDRLRMHQVLLEMKNAVEKNDPKSYWKLHSVFHEIFIDASENDVLINILHTLRMHSLWYRFSYQYYLEDLPGSLEPHERILELFDDPKTDPEALAALVKNHIEKATEIFLAYLEET
ncbi:MAG: GntR family transcriptional regulator [Desulfobacterales bacterium]